MKVEFFIDRPIDCRGRMYRPLFVAGGSIPADYTSYGENFGLLSRS